jgi:hypothetical protein
MPSEKQPLPRFKTMLSMTSLEAKYTGAPNLHNGRHGPGDPYQSNAWSKDAFHLHSLDI